MANLVPEVTEKENVAVVDFGVGSSNIISLFQGKPAMSVPFVWAQVLDDIEKAQCR